MLIKFYEYNICSCIQDVRCKMKIYNKEENIFEYIYNFMNVFYVWILWTYHIQIQFQYLTYNQLPEMDRKKYLTHYQNRVQIFFPFQLFYLHMFGKIQKIKKNISYTYFQSDYDRFRWYFYSIYNFSNE